MYIEVVKYLESAICDLLLARRAQLRDILVNVDHESDIHTIAFEVFPWHESLQISFGTKSDYNSHPASVADWKYYAFCNSSDIKSVNIAAAIKAIKNYYEMQDLQVLADEGEGGKEVLSRLNIIFLAAAQALLSPTVWHIYNQLKLSILEERYAQWKSENRSLYDLEYEMENLSTDQPGLRCLVLDSDATVNANYCEILKSIRMLGGEADEVIGYIFE